MIIAALAFKTTFPRNLNDVNARKVGKNVAGTSEADSFTAKRSHKSALYPHISEAALPRSS